MNNQIKLSADQLADAIKESEEVREYIKAVDDYNNDEEINSLIEKYYSMNTDFQKIQKARTLTQEERDNMKSIVDRLNSNQLTSNVQNVENKMLDLLIECNGEISAVINMDFAKLAAPSTSCCG
ncbi:hypothetical protein MNBD_IGNAVI01-3079 [hydrothermal vent metagenome]|uniref:YlbF family regulator n=1 Tax=hydrothermal vent metagenome TaxID=652676 RepID=A0A3B1DB20_9ZZZZ